MTEKEFRDFYNDVGNVALALPKHVRNMDKTHCTDEEYFMDIILTLFKFNEFKFCKGSNMSICDEIETKLYGHYGPSSVVEETRKNLEESYINTEDNIGALYCYLAHLNSIDIDTYSSKYKQIAEVYFHLTGINVGDKLDSTMVQLRKDNFTIGHTFIGKEVKIAVDDYRVHLDIKRKYAECDGIDIARLSEDNNGIFSIDVDLYNLHIYGNTICIEGSGENKDMTTRIKIKSKI